MCQITIVTLSDSAHSDDAEGDGRNPSMSPAGPSGRALPLSRNNPSSPSPTPPHPVILDQAVASSVLAPVFNHLFSRSRARGSGRGQLSRPEITWQNQAIIERDTQEEETVRQRIADPDPDADLAEDPDEVPEDAEPTGQESASRRPNFSRSKEILF